MIKAKKKKKKISIDERLNLIYILKKKKGDEIVGIPSVETTSIRTVGGETLKGSFIMANPKR